MSGFDPGATVALRELWQRRVWKARPAIVVRDDAELIALWTPEATAMQIADSGSGIPAASWHLVPFLAEAAALRLHAPGSPLVHVALWRDGRFDGWKVDVVRPLRRFAVGFEYLDLELDVRLPVTGPAQVVDEQEFHESRRRGVIDEREADAVRRAAHEALAAAEVGASPFADGWSAWLPDPSWAAPVLPGGWDAPGRDLPPLR